MNRDEKLIDMKTEFLQVAHLYKGCQIQYPNPDGGKPIVAKLTGVTSDGFETTYKRKKSSCSGDLISFKDGKERGHETYVENCKPILKSLSDMPLDERIQLIALINDELVENITVKTNSKSYMVYIDGETEEDDSEAFIEKHMFFDGFNPYQFLWLLSKGYDLFDLIPNGFAINQTT